MNAPTITRHLIDEFTAYLAISDALWLFVVWRWLPPLWRRTVLNSVLVATIIQVTFWVPASADSMRKIEVAVIPHIESAGRYLHVEVSGDVTARVSYRTSNCRTIYRDSSCFAISADGSTDGAMMKLGLPDTGRCQIESDGVVSCSPQEVDEVDIRVNGNGRFVSEVLDVQGGEKCSPNPVHVWLMGTGGKIVLRDGCHEFLVCPETGPHQISADDSVQIDPRCRNP
jgi:hypothetical protein